MTLFHAVVWVDHQTAQVLQFDAEHVEASKVKAHVHHTAQHASGVRTDHGVHRQRLGSAAKAGA